MKSGRLDAYRDAQRNLWSINQEYYGTVIFLVDQPELITSRQRERQRATASYTARMRIKCPDRAILFSISFA